MLKQRGMEFNSNVYSIWVHTQVFGPNKCHEIVGYVTKLIVNKEVIVQNKMFR